nr:hypothetical protein [Tanacetum cinerariifolium]
MLSLEYLVLALGVCDNRISNLSWNKYWILGVDRINRQSAGSLGVLPSLSAVSKSGSHVTAVVSGSVYFATVVVSGVSEVGYVAESDPEEDHEEYEEDETEDGPVDYPVDGGDDGDDNDGDSSGYDADDEDEEEEHLAPADSAVVMPIDELVSPPEETEPTIPLPSTDTTTTRATITIRP